MCADFHLHVHIHVYMYTIVCILAHLNIFLHYTYYMLVCTFPVDLQTYHTIINLHHYIIQAHAARTGHANFSESTEAIKPLTDEEKRAQLAK